MSQTLKISNYGSNNLLQATELRDQALAGASNITVENSADAVQGSYAILGVLGSNSSEMVQVDTIPDGTSLNLLAATKLPHSFGDPLTYLFGNQIKIYRAPNVDGTQPADEQFASIATIDIDANQALSQYTDQDGGGDYWYKATFFNTTSSAESGLALATARRGDLNQHFCTLAQIRSEAGFANAPFITDELIDEKRSVAEAEAISALTGVYQLPLPQPINPNVMQATMEIAAGLLMQAQYGNMNPTLDQKGKDKVTSGRNTLQLIATRVLILDDASFNDSALSDNPNTPDLHFGVDIPDQQQEIDSYNHMPREKGGRLFHIEDKY